MIDEIVGAEGADKTTLTSAIAFATLPFGSTAWTNSLYPPREGASAEMSPSPKYSDQRPEIPLASTISIMDAVLASEVLSPHFRVTWLPASATPLMMTPSAASSALIALSPAIEFSVIEAVVSDVSTSKFALAAAPRCVNAAATPSNPAILPPLSATSPAGIAIPSESNGSEDATV